MYKLFILLVLITSFNVQETMASKPLIISEKMLLNTESPILKLYRIDQLNSEISLSEFEGNFSPNVDFSFYHKTDKQKALSSNGFDKAPSPIHQKELSISKPFMFGANLKFKLYQSEITNPFITDSAATGAGLELALDLINGLWKQTAKNSYKMQQTNVKLQKSIKSYKTYLLKNNIRKIYWNLVANDLSLKVLEELLKNSKKTVETIAKRYRASIADKGDLSRVKAQVKSTEALIISYTYQKEQLIKNLKEFLKGDIENNNLALAPYRINHTINQIKACTTNIAINGLNYNNSLLQEQSNFIKELNTLKQKIDHTYGDVDVKLIGTFDKIGKGIGMSNSNSDLTSDGQNAYSIGLSVSVPLGSSKTEDLKVKMNKLQSQSLIQKNFLKMKSFHNQTVRMITLLNQAISNQIEQNKLLNVSLKSSKRKYKQARLTIEQLIGEENNLLQSDLNIIQTKLNVVLTLLDYFSVFNKTKCNFNKITNI